MKKMIAKIGRNMLLPIVLGTAIVSQMFACGYDDSIKYPVISYSLSGQVTSEESGLAGVTITLSGAGQDTTVSDAAGNYTFSGLLNGSYTLTPSQTGFIFTPSSHAQTISGANITAVNFTATPTTLPTFTIAGTVTSADGGLAGVSMTLSGVGSGTVITDDAGHYLFSGLVKGSYTVTPTSADFIFNPLNSEMLVDSASITDINFSAVPTPTVQLVTCPTSETTNVMIQDFAFTLAAITIGVNSIVQWTNFDSLDHTVTSGTSPDFDGKFDSGVIGVGESVCYQFLKTGTYPYFCSNHPLKTGSVTVQ